MKISALLFVMFMAVTVAHGQSDIESKIITAKIYTQGAELKRTASLKLKKGKNEFKLIKLSANLDPKTIQISGEDITILSVRHETDYIETNKPEKVKRLLERRLSIVDSVELIQMQLSILEKEKELLSKNMKVVGSEGTKGSDYKMALEYFSIKFEKNAKESFRLKLAIRALEEKTSQVEIQIKSHNTEEDEPTSNIFLVLNVDQDMNREISISYAISEAGWFPAYDIRATDVKSPLSLTYKARVFQNTGVDWKNTKLTLSSGDLESSGTAPKLVPFHLGRSNQIFRYDAQGQVYGQIIGSDDGLPLPQVTVSVKGTTIGTNTSINGNYNLQLPNGYNTLIFRYLGYVTQEVEVGNDPQINLTLVPDVTSLGEVVSYGYSSGGSAGFSTAPAKDLKGKVAGIRIRGASSLYGSRAPSQEFLDNLIVDKDENNPLPINYINYQTTFVYEIEHPYDIPSTGQSETVDIQTLEIHANYIYSTSPKAKENAYLVAEIPDWEKLKLLDGESNLYFEESFVGKSIIDTNIGKDTLDISMGKDEGIVVSRKRLKEFEKEKIFSNKKREERTFEITIVNTKSTKININIYDQIPIISNKNYKVNTVDLGDAELDKESGLLTWNAQLGPGEKKIIRFSYSVDYPRYMTLDID